ncbi:MAG: AraC family transcriptional regulator [Rhizobiaceae bacterium]|nr:AraC family transcriptional regulator [Rhizobiaceae bacterium]
MHTNNQERPGQAATFDAPLARRSPLQLAAFDPGHLAVANKAISQTQTNSPAEAHRLLCSRYKSHDLKLSNGAAGFDFLHVSTRVSAGSLNILKYGAGVTIDPDNFEDFYMLEVPLEGGVDIRINNQDFNSRPEAGLIISPGQRLVSFWRPGTTQFMLKIDRDFLLKRWNLLTGRAEKVHPIFRTSVDFSTPEGWRIRNLMGLLMEEFVRFAHDRAWQIETSTLSHAVVDALLMSIEHDQTPLLPNASANILPRHVRACTRYISENLASPVSVAELAKAADVSERSVFEGFRHYLSATPMQYVLETRLMNARQMLLSEKTTVAAAMKQCGFRHAGRFSKYYMDRFGEYPSRTAKK